jgi:LPS sulfotransferase NodH
MATNGESFVVLTTQRSGSVWLMSTLNSLKDVTAHGELLLPRSRSRDLRWDSDFARPRYIESGLRSPRPFSLFSYLNGLYRTPGTVGFKLMYSQLRRYPETLAYLIARRIRVVHLVRENHLDVLISHAVKARLGRAHLLAGDDRPEEVRVELEVGSLLQRMERLQTKQKLARWLLAWSGLSHLEVAYEDMVRERRRFRDITDFLRIDSVPANLTSGVVRIRRGGQAETVLNFDEVRSILVGSKFAQLVE